MIAEFSGENRFADLQEEEILAEYNIYRNPSWLMMKGNVKFQKQSGSSMTELDLRFFAGGVGVSNQDVETIRWAPDLRPERQS